MCVIHHRHYPIETNQSISGPSTLLKLRVIETLFCVRVADIMHNVANQLMRRPPGEVGLSHCQRNHS